MERAPDAGDRRQVVRWRPVSAEEKERILADPLVAETIELFDGVMVNAQHRCDDPASDRSGAADAQDDESE